MGSSSGMASGIASTLGPAAPIIGGIMGNAAASGDRTNAQNAYQNALAQYQAIGIPAVQAQQLALQDETVQGYLNPQNQTATSQGPNALNNVQADPRLQQAQMNALQTLQSIGQNGMTAQMQAQLDAVNRQAGQQNNAQQNSILQSMAQRGAAGGGLELATRLSAAQGAANMAGQQSDNVMSQAQQNMLNAVGQSGQLSGQMQQQAYNQADTAAQAQNAINQFNAQQQNRVNAANTQAANQAAAQNLSQQQAIANYNTQLSNQQQQYNTGLLQQQFQNQLALANPTANAQYQYGNFMNQLGNSTAAGGAAVGAGAGQMINGAGGLAAGAATGGASNIPYNSSNYSTIGMTPQTTSGGYGDSAGDVYSSSPASSGLLNSSGGTAGAGEVFTAAHGGRVPGYNYGGPIPPYSNGGQVMNTGNSIPSMSPDGYADGGIVDTTGYDAYKNSPTPTPTATPEDNSLWKQNAEDSYSSYKKKWFGGPVGMTDGGNVHGKAKVDGDSPKNDTVKALLSPGEIVIPRSHAMTEHLAKAYIQHLFGKEK